MSSKLTLDSFLACVTQSGLIESDRLDSLLAKLRGRGLDVTDPLAIAKGLVKLGALTKWQAENLLRGKRRGFTLGKYRILSMLGRGGMNTVYLAEHTLMRRRCAIKVLPLRSEGMTSHVERFLREGRAIAGLDHVNIVRAYDIDQTTDGDTEVHYFAMEFVDGESLSDRVAREGPLPLVDAVNAIRQAAEGLQHAHDLGIVHRDIKPANLLVDRGGVVKILDLGLAMFAEEGPSLTIAHNEKVLGTADFLSPEQALDSHQIDSRSDIYSLGCTLYYLLAGCPPFPEGTLPQRLLFHQMKEPAAIEERRADVPPDLAVLLRQMMAKQRDLRIATAREVSEQMRQWLVRHADQAWVRRNPAILSVPRAAKDLTARVGVSAAAAASASGGLSPASGSLTDGSTVLSGGADGAAHAASLSATQRISAAPTAELSMLDFSALDAEIPRRARRRKPAGWALFFRRLRDALRKSQD